MSGMSGLYRSREPLGNQNRGSGEEFEYAPGASILDSCWTPKKEFEKVYWL
jgi:hypothetical protein